MVKRWETLAALLAVILASAAAFPLPGRLGFAIAAILLIAVIGTARLRAARLLKRSRPISDAGARAERIREERSRRYR